MEPEKDAKGDVLQLQNTLTSPRRLHANKGADWSEIYPEFIEDFSAAIIEAKMAAMAINSSIDDGQPVHWRDLILLPMTNGVQMAMQDPNTLNFAKEIGAASE